MIPTEAAAEIITKLTSSPQTKEAKRRELFISYLSFLFPDYWWQISTYALGAEEPIKTVSRKGKKPTIGRIDTRKGGLLIEYKMDLLSPVQQKEAEDELRRYISGLANKEGLNAISKCISTDVLNWRQYDVSISPSVKKGKIKPTDVTLSPPVEYNFTVSDADSFVRTVRRIVFEDVALVATGKLLSDLFGLSSRSYSIFKPKLKESWDLHRTLPEAQLGLELWSKYLANCFDETMTPDEDSYLDHVYLVILARMLAASALATASERSASDFPQRAVTGDFFKAAEHRVDRFVEEDFFRWVKSDSALGMLKPALDDLHNELQKIDFRSAKKLDLLSDLYQEIMPPQKKAEYGQVFTPPWLVEEIVDNINKTDERGTTVLDPACGTGSFLRTVAIRKLSKLPKSMSPQERLESILQDICGLDINPVSVVIAKTTLMLSLADLLKESEKPVEIPIYLCDSLFLPKEWVSEKAEKISVTFDDSEVSFPSKLFMDGTFEFDELINKVDFLAQRLSTGQIQEIDCKSALKGLLEQIKNKLNLTPNEFDILVDSSLSLVKEFSNRISKRRNNVWAFILKNTYRPSLLKARFDVIVSNLPWLAMSALPKVPYKDELQRLSEYYQLSPSGPSKHHFDISTTYAVHCVAHYLVDTGLLGFILPRVILKGDHHDGLRRSRYIQKSPMRVNSVWDLENVSPLFGRPACVIFGQYDKKHPGFPKRLPCIEISGNPDKPPLTKKKVTLPLSILGNKSSYERPKSRLSEKRYYWPLFYQGADLMPRRAVMVDIVGQKNAAILSVQTSSIEKANRNNKSPWDKLDLKGTIERRFVFTTFKSDIVLPFIVGAPSFIVLPIEESPSYTYELLDQRTIVARGYDNAAKWFEHVDKELKKAGKKQLKSWLTRRNKLVDQSSKPHANMVLYGAGGKNICAAVTNVAALEFPFVNDQTLYSWDTSSLEEAWYVCAMLNSEPINDAIKNYQPSGDFDEQHIHKLPLSFIPTFNSGNQKHLEIVKEAMRIAKLVEGLCKTNAEYMNVRKPLASRRRLLLKELKPQLGQLNKLAKEILKEASAR